MLSCRYILPPNNFLFLSGGMLVIIFSISKCVFISLKILSVFIYLHVCIHVWLCMSWCAFGGRRITSCTLFSSSTQDQTQAWQASDFPCWAVLQALYFLFFLFCFVFFLFYLFVLFCFVLFVLFCFVLFFETGFLHVVLAVLELTL